MVDSAAATTTTAPAATNNKNGWHKPRPDAYGITLDGATSPLQTFCPAVV